MTDYERGDILAMLGCAVPTAWRRPAAPPLSPGEKLEFLAAAGELGPIEDTANMNLAQKYGTPPPVRHPKDFPPSRPLLVPTAPSPDNIDHFAQNKPSLIAKDLAVFGVPQHLAANILMARGVYKWFAARRQVISLKNNLRYVLTGSQEVLKELKALKPATRKEAIQKSRDIEYLRGYRQAVEDVHEGLKEITHGARWQFPDNDWRAKAMIEYGRDYDPTRK